MRIALVASRENEVDIFPALKKSLMSKAAGLEFEEFFAPGPDNIPAAAARAAETADLVFVLVLFEEASDDIAMLKEKLVDVEISSGKTILKCVQELELERDDQKDEYVQELSEKWTEKIINALFR